MISYVYNNNIYIYDIITKKTTACTNDGIKIKLFTEQLIGFMKKNLP